LIFVDLLLDLCLYIIFLNLEFQIHEYALCFVVSYVYENQ